MPELHPIQKKILDHLKQSSFEGKTLRDLAEEIGIDHPFKLSYHLDRLQKKGYLRINPANPTDYKILKHPIEDAIYLNVYSSAAQCGPEGLLAEEHVVDRIPVSTKQFGITDEKYFLVRAKGDSMEPKIGDGDLVLARENPDPAPGSLVVVVHNEVVKIKKYQVADNRGMLISLNESYPPEVVKKGDEFRKCGVIKNVIKIEGV